MKDEYQIMEIKGAHDSRYGDVAIVRANPVETNSMGMRFVTQHLCSDTEMFFFPDDDEILEPIIRIAQGQGIWRPNKNDYRDESILDEETNRRSQIHRHKSFWSNIYDRGMNSGYTPDLIPNKGYKARQLKEQFYRNGWYEEYTLRGYVVSLAEGDDVSNFWGWLFDNPALNGCLPWTLPSDYQQSYEDFLSLFDEDEF